MKDSNPVIDIIDNHNIILYVDTKNINKHNVEDKTSFYQYHKDRSNHDFVVKVKSGDSITWSGLSTSSPNDKVIITKIEYEAESNIFGRRKLHGECCGDNGRVIGTVRSDTKGESEAYKLYFQVCEGNNGGLKKKVYRIDPQIEVDP